MCASIHSGDVGRIEEIDRRMCMCHKRGAGVRGEPFAISKYYYNKLGLLTLIMDNREADLFEREAGVCERII